MPKGVVTGHIALPAFHNGLHDPADPGFVALDEAYLIVQGKCRMSFYLSSARRLHPLVDVTPQQLHHLLDLKKEAPVRAQREGPKT